jgi:hypothetical protein
MTRKELILKAITALDVANQAQQEVFEGDKSYKLHQALQDAIDDLEYELQEIEEQSKD